LIWSIEPGDPDFHHRLGGGKPYGFGSVKLSRQSVVVESGHEVADRYRTGSASAGITYDDLISAFREVFEQATGTSFETHPTVRAILVAGRGLWNISYPRTLEQMAEGRFDESFRWFVSNEKKEIPGSFQSLPQLDEEMPGLRALPDRAPKTTGQGGKGRGSGQGG